METRSNHSDTYRPLRQHAVRRGFPYRRLLAAAKANQLAAVRPGSRTLYATDREVDAYLDRLRRERAAGPLQEPEQA